MAHSIDIKIPHIGDFKDVPIVEIFVAVGDTLQKEEPLLAIESDKAVMEIPMPYAGKITSIEIKAGDTVSEGDVIMKAETDGSAPKQEEKKDNAVIEAAEVEVEEDKKEIVAEKAAQPVNNEMKSFHASPSVRLLARELDIELSSITANGPKGRITKEDLNDYIKNRMNSSGPVQDMQFSFDPKDFEQFGPVETESLNKIKQISSKRLKSSWHNIPHVTHVEHSDITNLEAYRKELNKKLAKENVKLSVLPFIIKVLVKALQKFPLFNASFIENKNQILLKKYYNIGCAVDTKDGLVVPVIKNADTKGILEITKEITEMAAKARAKRLLIDQLYGGTFTISSLGGIGGDSFSPIINPPESAIMGVSRAEIKPVWNKETDNFEPKMILTFSVSYDHRIIDGAEGARFCSYIAESLSDMRNILL